MPRKNNRYLARIVIAGILIASCVGCGGGSHQAERVAAGLACAGLQPATNGVALRVHGGVVRAIL